MIVLFCLVMLCNVYSGAIFAETIQLKDGNTLQGKIMKEDNEVIWLEIPFLNGKLVRKILKSDIKPWEVTVLEKKYLPQPQENNLSANVSSAESKNNPDTQKCYFGNILVEIPKEWRLFKVMDTGVQIFLIESDDNPYGNFRLFAAIDILSIKDAPAPHPANLEQLLEMEVAVNNILPYKMIKSGYSVVNGMKMGWILSFVKDMKRFVYIYFKNDNIYHIALSSPDIEISSYKNQFDSIISKIKLH